MLPIDFWCDALTFEHVVVDKSQIARGTNDKRDEKPFRSRVSLVHVHSAATASARALGYAQVVHAVIQCYMRATLRNFFKDARSIAPPSLLSLSRVLRSQSHLREEKFSLQRSLTNVINIKKMLSVDHKKRALISINPWVKMNIQGDETQYQVHKFRLTFLRITKFFEKVSSLFLFQDSRKRNNR